jgi:hypothetical protein
MDREEISILEPSIQGVNFPLSFHPASIFQDKICLCQDCLTDSGQRFCNMIEIAAHGMTF